VKEMMPLNSHGPQPPGALNLDPVLEGWSLVDYCHTLDRDYGTFVQAEEER